MTFSRAWLVLSVVTALGCGVNDGANFGDPNSSSSDLTSCATGTTLKGVDVSHYDGTINWNSAKAAGISFAFAKATQGDSYVDNTFATNWAGMKAAGVIRG